jgi:pimeloyl-ACP methyl ester carboxylesterase
MHNRRQHLCGLAGTLALSALASEADAANANVLYGQDTLPDSIRSRRLENINGLSVHMLEAGFETPNRPLVLFLHGFPELAYSWRKVMVTLAARGFHTVAPDQRGFGRTTGWDMRFEADLTGFSTLTMVRDALALVSALGYRTANVVGHDAGSPVAGWCALSRPDVFKTVAMMSAPFGGAPVFTTTRPTATAYNLDEALAALPHPRKYYQRYYTTRGADNDMRNAPQGLAAFFRAYYHYKSADWKQNQPFPLKTRTAEEFAKMPTYYVMDLNKNMAETVAPVMPTPAEIAANKWFTDADVAVYASEYGRVGFQGGLQGYRRGLDPHNAAELLTFAGRTIDVPSVFISGKSDWGVYQSPGALENMRTKACTNMTGVHLVEGAGHWVQQEQPEEVSRLLLAFLGQKA